MFSFLIKKLNIFYTEKTFIITLYCMVNTSVPQKHRHKRTCTCQRRPWSIAWFVFPVSQFHVFINLRKVFKININIRKSSDTEYETFKSHGIVCGRKLLLFLLVSQTLVCIPQTLNAYTVFLHMCLSFFFFLTIRIILYTLFNTLTFYIVYCRYLFWSTGTILFYIMVPLYGYTVINQPLLRFFSISHNYRLSQ